MTQIIVTSLSNNGVSMLCWDSHGRDRVAARFTTAYTISAYHHQCCELEPGSWRGVLDTTLCNKICG